MTGLAVQAAVSRWAFSLLMVSGLWKSLVGGLGYAAPDLTVVAVVALVCALGLRVATRGARVPRKTLATLIFFVLLCSLCFLSFWWTDAPETAQTRLLSLGLCIVAFAAPLLLEVDGAPALIRSLVRASSGTMVAFVLLFPTFYSNRSSLGDGVFSIYLQAGYLAGLIVVLIAHGGLQMGPKERWFHFGVCVFALMISGARGPIAATVLSVAAIAAFAGLSLRRVKLSRRAIASVLGAVVALGLASAPLLSSNAFSELLERTGLRFLALVDGSDVASANERVEYAGAAVSLLLESPLQLLVGRGVGSFGHAFYGVDTVAHPHNTFLEVAVELGVFALAAYVALWGSLLVRTARCGDRVLLAVAFYLLLNTMKSFSIYDSRIMFGVMGLATMMLCQTMKTSNKARVLS